MLANSISTCTNMKQGLKSLTLYTNQLKSDQSPYFKPGTLKFLDENIENTLQDLGEASTFWIKCE